MSTTLLAYVLGLMAVFFVWGFLVARARGRSAIVWGIACALTYFIGIAILYSLGDNKPVVVRDKRDPANHRLPAQAVEYSGRVNSSAAPATLSRDNLSPTSIESADDRRWRYLSEYHPEVRKSLESVAPLGDDAVAELKEAHLAVNDPAVLPAIVQRIGERFGAEPQRFLNGSANGRTSISGPRIEQETDEEEPLMLDVPVGASVTPRRFPIASGARAASVEVGRAGATAMVARTNGHDSAREQPIEQALPLIGSGPAIEASSESPSAADREASHQSTSAEDIEDIEIETESETDLAADVDYDDNALTEDPDGGSRRESFGISQDKDVPSRTTVTPTDLEGARFLETYAGVHLFGLVDGRIFIDRHEARPSLELARNLVDQVASRRALS